MTDTPLVCSVVRMRCYMTWFAMLLLLACSESESTPYTPSNPLGVTYEPTAEWQLPEGGPTLEPEERFESDQPSDSLQSDMPGEE